MRHAGILWVVLFAALVMTVPAQGQWDILFIGDLDDDGGGDGNVAANAAADQAMIDRLSTTLGHNVATHDDSGVTLAVTTALDYDFIVVSATASSGAYATDDSGDSRTGAVNSLATDAKIVLMEGGNAIMSAFAINPMGNASLGTQTGTAITIAADDGYVTDGFSPGSLTIFSSASAIGTWGTVPGDGAILGYPGLDFSGTYLASVPDGNFGIYGVDDVVAGTKAIGDNGIVLLPFHNAAFTQANANGLQLWDNVFVPEPTTGLLLVFGVMGLLTRRSRG